MAFSHSSRGRLTDHEAFRTARSEPTTPVHACRQLAPSAHQRHFRGSVAGTNSTAGLLTIDGNRLSSWHLTPADSRRRIAAGGDEPGERARSKFGQEPAIGSVHPYDVGPREYERHDDNGNTRLECQALALAKNTEHIRAHVGQAQMLINRATIIAALFLLLDVIAVYAYCLIVRGRYPPSHPWSGITVLLMSMAILLLSAQRQGANAVSVRDAITIGVALLMAVSAALWTVATIAAR